MNGVNLRRFEFDYDVTWNSFFLDEKLNVYSRYGGRDGGEPENRLSKDALLTTMRRVLVAHAEARANPERRAELIAPIEPGKSTPEDIPLLKQNHNGCVHCHQVREYQLLQWSHDGEFDRRKLFAWPLPENVGIELDLKHGSRVKKVPADSASERAGMKPGDVIVRANDTPIRSEYDLRWALHRADDAKPFKIVVARNDTSAVGPREKDDPPSNAVEEPGTSVALELKLEGDWRQTDLGWRKSLRSVPMEFGIRGYALTRSQRAELKLSEQQMSLRIVSVKPRGLAASLDLRKGDTIVAHGESTADRTFEQLLSDILRQHQPGAPVELTVLRDGERLKLRGKLPAWHTDETSVP